jgi:hypothetical protein
LLNKELKQHNDGTIERGTRSNRDHYDVQRKENRDSSNSHRRKHWDHLNQSYSLLRGYYRYWEYDG